MEFEILRRLVLFLLVLAASPAFAQNTPYDQIIAALRAKGYIIIIDERTWLGRQRIVADNGEFRRELVFNPGTGEIFRDYAVLLHSDSQRSGPAAVAASDGGVVGQDAPNVTSGVLGSSPPTSSSDVVDPEFRLSDPIVTELPEATN